MEDHPVTFNVTTYQSIVYKCVSSFKCHLYIYITIPKITVIIWTAAMCCAHEQINLDLTALQTF